MNKALNLINQIELFFKNVGNNCVDKTQSNSISASYQAINSKIEQLKNFVTASNKNRLIVERTSQACYHDAELIKDEILFKQLKLTFMNDASFEEFKQLNNCFKYWIIISI